MSLRNCLRCDRGVAAVEFAVIGVVLIGLTVASIEFGRALFLKHQLSTLADAASRSILLNSSVTDATLVAEAQATFTAGNPADLTLTLSMETVRGTTFRSLEISYPLTLLIPDLAPDSITITVERRVPHV